MKGKYLLRVNDWFESFSQGIVRFRWLTIGVVVAATVLCAFGLGMLKMDNSTESWFESGAEIERAKKRFEAVFGNTDIVGLLVEADDVFAPDILQLLRDLGTDLETKVSYADKVISLASFEYIDAEEDEIFIDGLVPEEILIEPEQIEQIRTRAFSKNFLVNRLFADDSKSAWVMLRLYPFPDDWEDRKDAVDKSFKQFSSANRTTFRGVYEKSPERALEEFAVAILKWAEQHELIIDEQTILKTDLSEATNGNSVFKIVSRDVAQQISMQVDSPLMRVGNQILSLLAQEKYQDYTIKPVGNAVMAVEEGGFLMMEMARLAGLAILISMIVLAVFIRNVRGVLIPIFSTIIAIIIVFGIMGFLGVKVNSMVMSVPIFLTFAVSVGYSIHQYNFFKQLFKLGGKRKQSIYYSIKNCGWPIFFTAMTTIAALLSFNFIRVIPIKWLGLSSASLIAVVYILIMTFMPALMSFGKDKNLKKAKTLKKPGEREKERWTDRAFSAFGRWVLKRSKPIMIIFIIITGILIYGVTKTEINISPEISYGKKIWFINRMLEVARSKTGSFQNYNVVVELPDTDAIKDPDVLNRFDKLLSAINNHKLTKRTNSVLSIVKELNQLYNGNNPDYYRIPESRELVSQLLFLYEMSGGSEASSWIDNDYRRLRIMAEVEELSGMEMRQIASLVSELGSELFPEATIELTGGMIRMEALNYFISKGQIVSFLIAIIVITALLMLVFMSIKIGLIGIIPNIMPALAVGGVMGFMGAPVSFLTITIMPMVLGLAVDDTIHFISHANLQIINTGNYQKGILRTYRSVGRSLFMTSAILIAAFSMYFTSVMRMYLELGMLVIVGIASALIADFFVTPVLLAWFKPFGEAAVPIPSIQED